MGAFGSDSTTRNTTNLFDQRIAGSDQAAIDARRQSAGKGSNVLSNSTQINTRGGDLEYSSDPELLRAAIDAVSSQSDRFAESLTEIFAASSDAQSAQALSNALSQKSLLEETFDKLAGLAASSQSDGDTDRNKIVLYISLAALALVAILFFNRR